jgi:hypothetical protein
MNFLSPTFECNCVPCLSPECDGAKTRLPLPIPEDIETNRINSPTEFEPLLVLCTRCGKVSKRTSRDELESQEFPQSVREGGTLFHVIEFLCDVEGCVSPLRICARTSAPYTSRHLLEVAKQYAMGDDSKCFCGHTLTGRHNPPMILAEY